MNNSRLALENVLREDEPVDVSHMLRQRETEIQEILESLVSLHESTTWKVLYNRIFQREIETLQRKLRSEKDTTELFRLQGKAEIVEKYFDIPRLVEMYRNELANIRKQLHAQ
jgi:hypothetical protein